MGQSLFPRHIQFLFTSPLESNPIQVHSNVDLPITGLPRKTRIESRRMPNVVLIIKMIHII